MEIYIRIGDLEELSEDFGRLGNNLFDITDDYRTVSYEILNEVGTDHTDDMKIVMEEIGKLLDEGFITIKKHEKFLNNSYHDYEDTELLIENETLSLGNNLYYTPGVRASAFTPGVSGASIGALILNLGKALPPVKITKLDLGKSKRKKLIIPHLKTEISIRKNYEDDSLRIIIGIAGDLCPGAEFAWTLPVLAGMEAVGIGKIAGGGHFANFDALLGSVGNAFQTNHRLIVAVGRGYILSVIIHNSISVGEFSKFKTLSQLIGSTANSKNNVEAAEDDRKDMGNEIPEQDEEVRDIPEEDVADDMADAEEGSEEEGADNEADQDLSDKGESEGPAEDNDSSESGDADNNGTLNKGGETKEDGSLNESEESEYKTPNEGEGNTGNENQGSENGEPGSGNDEKGNEDSGNDTGGEENNGPEGGDNETGNEGPKTDDGGERNNGSENGDDGEEGDDGSEYDNDEDNEYEDDESENDENEDEEESEDGELEDKEESEDGEFEDDEESEDGELEDDEESEEDGEEPENDESENNEEPSESGTFADDLGGIGGGSSGSGLGGFSADAGSEASYAGTMADMSEGALGSMPDYTSGYNQSESLYSRIMSSAGIGGAVNAGRAAKSVRTAVGVGIGAAAGGMSAAGGIAASAAGAAGAAGAVQGAAAGSAILGADGSLSILSHIIGGAGITNIFDLVGNAQICNLDWLGELSLF